MRALIFGGVGGLTPLLAVLITREGEPLASYIANADLTSVNAVLVGFFIKGIALFLIGLVWVVVNKETDPVKALQLGIAAPAVIVGMIAANEIKVRTDPPPSVGAPLLGLSLISPAYAQGNEAQIHPVEGFFGDVLKGILNEPIVDSVPIERLPSLFNGDQRRLASDRLIALYPDNKQAVVAALIGAIEGETPSSYRVNIYVARTLADIPEGWEGSDSQLESVKGLTGSSNYGDPTFQENVDRAITNWRLQTSPTTM
jgi:hypothetical protein